MRTVIEVDAVDKMFRSDWTLQKKKTLHAVSFSVQVGECFGFVGPNGAGKTTTIKLLVDLIRPSAGKVRLFGLPPADKAARARVGFLPERPYFYDHLSGEETLRLYAALSKVPHAQIDSRVDEMLQLVGLNEARRQALRRYSKGMLQRCGLGTALIAKPELIILDEPMSGLDPVGRRHVRDIILQERARGATVFFSSHILSDVEAICDRVAMIHKGEVVLTGSVSELVARAGTDDSELVVLLPAGKTLPAACAGFVAAARGHYHGVVANALLQCVLAELVSAGIPIVSVSPRRGTLEDEFLKGIGEGLAAARTVA